MKVRVCYTHYVDDEMRQAVWWHYSGTDYEKNPLKCPMAPREDINALLVEAGTSVLRDVLEDWEDACLDWQNPKSEDSLSPEVKGGEVLPLVDPG